MRPFCLAIGVALTGCESAPSSALEQPGLEGSAAVAPVAREPSPAPAEVAPELQLAIAEGRLADVHDLAHWLSTHELTEQPGWRPYLDELHRAAGNIERASDVASAGVELGRLGHACGACHRDAGATIAWTASTPPRETRTLTEQMRREQWAAARMGEGVEGADRGWGGGAGVRGTTPGGIAAEMRDKPNLAAFELADRFYDQAAQAAALQELDARAKHFGEVMQTCASCHQILRPHPVIDNARMKPYVSSR